METLKSLIDRAGFEYIKPDPLKCQEYAKALGYEMTPEAAAVAMPTMREAVRIHTICDSCKGYTTCALENHRGYTAKLVIGKNMIASLEYRECDKHKAFVRKIETEKLLASSMIPEMLKEMSFKAYDQIGNENPYQAAKDYLHRHGKGKGMVFSGPTGTGKTHLAMAVLNNWIILGREGLYVTVPQLFKQIGSSYGDKTYDKLMDTLSTVPLLLLDDLGAEKVTDIRMEELFIVVNNRMNAGLNALITTNLDLKEITERYGSRVSSRVSAMCDWFVITGPDRRTMQ